MTSSPRCSTNVLRDHPYIEGLRKWAVCLVALIGVFSFGGPVAFGQPADGDATEDDGLKGESVQEYADLVAAGETAFEKGEWGVARASFEKAYNLHPRPLLLFNIASTYRREGNREEALRYYEKYLEVAPANADYRGVAKEAVVNLEEQIRASKESEGPTPVAPVKPRSRGGKIQRYAGIGVGVVGIGLLGFGVYRGSQARDLNNFFEELDPGTEWTTELQDDFDRGESLETQAIIFSVAGGIALVAGGVLVITGIFAESDGDERQLSVIPVAGPDSAGFALGGRF